MMKIFVLSFVALSLFSLCGCSVFHPGSQPSGEVVVYYPKPEIEHRELSMLELGRTISHNQVDIFDPSLSLLTVTPLDPEPTSILAKFPPNPHMFVRDENVMIFSIDSSSPLNVLDDIDQPAAAVNEESPLPS